MADCAIRQDLKLIRGVPVISHFADNWEQTEAFQARPDDLLIATYPKSGTTWVGEIVDAIYRKGDVEACRRLPIYDRIPFLEYARPGVPTGVSQLSVMPPPRLLKSHLPVQLLPKTFWEENSKIIYVARNAKDVAVSYFCHYQMGLLHPEPGTWEEFLEKYMSGAVSCGSWYDHVKDWREKAKHHPILWLLYEDMQEDLKREIKKILHFLEKDLDEVVLEKITHHTSFEEMRQNPMILPTSMTDPTISRFMRKGIVGDWKNHFTMAQNERFDADYQEKMAASDLLFRSEI